MGIPAAGWSAIHAGTALLGGWLGSRKSAADKQLTNAQTNAAVASSDLAKQMSGFADRQFTMAQPVYNQALNYYTALAGQGGNAKLGQILQPQVNRISDNYRGAMTSAHNSLRGPQRDRALEDLNRQRVWQLSELGPAQREAANAKLLGVGGDMLDRASQFGQAAGNNYFNTANMYGQIAQDERARRQGSMGNFMSMGKDWARLWLPYLTKGKVAAPTGGG